MNRRYILEPEETEYQLVFYFENLEPLIICDYCGQAIRGPNLYIDGRNYCLSMFDCEENMGHSDFNIKDH